MKNETNDIKNNVSPKTNKKNDYTAEQIQVLGGIEAVRKRPAMYIGDTGRRGLHHLVYEVVDNAIDEAMSGYCTNIDIIIKKDNSVIIKDDGRGIPTEEHPKLKKSALEIVMTMLHAGGKFEKKAYEISGGLHGVGVSVVNALSEQMEVEVRRQGNIWRQKYEKGKPVTPVEITGHTTAHGTTVHFKPDPEIFQVLEFDYDILATRLRELTFLNPGVKISIFDENSSNKNIFYSEEGIIGFIKYLNQGREVLHDVLNFTKTQNNVTVDIAMQYRKAYSPMILSFVNNINTIEGGTHLTGFKTALTRAVNEYSKSKKIKQKLSGDDLKEGLTVIISIKVPEPQFEGQTKTRLGNSEVKGIVHAISYEKIKCFLEENPVTANIILNKVMRAARAREAAQKARELIRRKSALESMVLPGKLADCTSKKLDESEIFIVEGDSAGGCFSGDTKVALTDGRNVTFKQLIEEEKQGKKNFCYTIKKDGTVGIELIKNPRRTRTKAEVIKIILDNEEEIICTPDHKFMLRDANQYIQAKDIGKSMSLMPLKRKISELGQKLMLDAVKNYNHKIKQIVRMDEKVDVYDLEVEGTHNFALASGVFVHNSSKQARDRHTQAILPLRGKILNVEKAQINKILNNVEIQTLIKAIGTGIGDDFNNDKLRYGKIIIMTDADIDGAHIRTLLLTFFYRHMTALIENGRIYIATPPLYMITKGKKVRYAYSDNELESIVKAENEKYNLQRYKGLGEMNPEQLWETTMNPETRTLVKITIEDAVYADQLFSILMGEDVEPRREFIYSHAKDVKMLDI